FDTGDHRLFSYAQNYCAGARALRGQRAPMRPFVPSPLPLDPGSPREVSIDALARFFENPARAFLQRRLSLYLGRDSETVDDPEPLELNALQEWVVGDGILKQVIEGTTVEDVLPAVQARGALPPGMLGRCVIDALGAEVTEIAAAASSRRDGEQLAPLVVD